MKTLAFRATLVTVLRGCLPLVVVFALLLSGCALKAFKAYEGPELAKSEISVIIRSNSTRTFPLPALGHETYVLGVDGKTGPGLVYHVRPGQHTAEVLYRTHALLFSIYRAILTINFTTEAGHEYYIPARRRHGRDWIWVEDFTTGKVVAGEKPRDDEGAGRPPATPSE